jgi:UDP-glucose 4-epimerase
MAIESHGCDAVIHLAGLKSVDDSLQNPLAYYDNNVAGTICLLEAMQETGVKTLVFSSSATVYGDPETLPIPESHSLSSSSPYGQTKIVIEDLLRDWHKTNPQACVAILRYFNPVGAHSSGLIGEDPKGTPGNLMPFLAQVAVGRREKLSIWGNDYPTPDGTGVRDYIHVMDLASGHVRALEHLRDHRCITVNLGTGRGYSVLEVVRAFAAASGQNIPYEHAPRRVGDVASCYADPSYAKKLLGWQAQYGIEAMCADHWRWQQMNPEGYATPFAVSV